MASGYEKSEWREASPLGDWLLTVAGYAYIGMGILQQAALIYYLARWIAF